MKRLLILLLSLAWKSGFSQSTDVMPRPPRPTGELAALLAATHAGEPQFYKNLTIFPLYTAGRATEGYRTLDEALAKGLLWISEKGEGSVPELMVENRSDETVFLMAGEIVTGGKQNRVVSQDILLAPHTGPVALGVYCVEQGRWVRQTQYFGAESEMAHAKMRQTLNVPAVSQSAIWGEVARKAEAVAPATPNETRYLGRVFEDREVKRQVYDYGKTIVLPSDANGMAVVIAGRVVGVEVFGDTETFAKMRSKLLRSYAVDAIEESQFNKPGGDSRATVERFLRLASRARLVTKQTIGVGRLLGVEGAGVYGSLLLWHEQKVAGGAVHASLFAGATVEPRPVIRPWLQE